MKKYQFFKIEGNRITRVRKHCPKCGPAVFLAEHKDRFSCGQCGYAEYKGGMKQPVNNKPDEVNTEEK
jgi:small subunit ribosomal protein S27Ae